MITVPLSKATASVLSAVGLTVFNGEPLATKFCDEPVQE